jgi:hypothetical protein
LRISPEQYLQLRSVVLASADSLGYVDNVGNSSEKIAVVRVSASEAEADPARLERDTPSTLLPSPSPSPPPDCSSAVGGPSTTASCSNVSAVTSARGYVELRPFVDDILPFAVTACRMMRSEAVEQGFGQVLAQDFTSCPLPCFPPPVMTNNALTGATAGIGPPWQCGSASIGGLNDVAEKASEGRLTPLGTRVKLRILTPLSNDFGRASAPAQHVAKRMDELALANLAPSTYARCSANEGKKCILATELSEAAVEAIAGIQMEKKRKVQSETVLDATTVVAVDASESSLHSKGRRKRKRVDDLSPRRGDVSIHSNRDDMAVSRDLMSLTSAMPGMYTKQQASAPISPVRTNRAQKNSDSYLPPAISARSLRSNDKKYEFRAR